MSKKFYRYKRFWLLLLITTYLLLGFFYVPSIIKQQIQEHMSLQLDMQADMSKVKFNPLTFTTEITDLQLTDANQQKWYSSKITGINFDPLNLLWGQWKFSDLNLVQPQITLVTNEAGQVIIPALPEFPEGDGNNEPIDISIDDIRMDQGRMNLQAGNIKKDFNLNIKRIEISHDKFIVNDEDTRFDIAITTEFDEVLTLNGHYNHAQQHISSQVLLKDWQATTLNKFLPDSLMINNQAGTVQATGSIDWVLSQNPLINFSNIEIAELQTNWQEQVQLTGLQSTITSTRIDTKAQTILIETISSAQGQWQTMWPINIPAEDEVSSGANIDVSGTTDTEQAAWKINIQQIKIKDWPVTLKDTVLQAELPFTVQSLTIDAINNQSIPFQVTSLIELQGGGSLNINSEQSLTPLNLSSNINITDLSLPQLSPWITDSSGLVFTQGTLVTRQKLQLTEQHFDLSGELSVNTAIIENQAGQNIAEVGQLLVEATTISSQNKTIVVDQITLDHANGNIIIDADNNINIQNLKPADVTQNEIKSEPSTDTTDWIIKVGTINIKDTSTALIDQSVQPEVKTSISELNGAIKGLSSETLSKAEVEITGKFNQFSPLKIEGQINPLSSDAYTDLKVLIEDLDLLAFSPYSANYLAFPINGGKLNVELEYSLNQHELRGKNNLLFKQFKLGDRMDSPDAIKLPLKLAITLLSDMNGEMKINLPVSGNLNDPEFSYGGLIGKAFFKLITTIITSPFKILSALIPNPDPNLSDIQFTPGSAELQPSELNKLNQIAEIIAKKPELKLQLNPHIDPKHDTQALQQIILLSTAPFDAFDLSDAHIPQWLKTQLTIEELTAFKTEAGYDYEQIWLSLVSQQEVSPDAINSLTQQRNLSIKNHLLEAAGITADKVFIEQEQATENNQAVIKIGVSR